MSPEELAHERTKQRVELWKAAVGTQQHFNTLQLQLRNFALTLFLATLTAAGYALKEHVLITLFGFTTSIATIACLGGCVVICAFYYMDWGYHQLLKGAVEYGKAVEGALNDAGLDAGLAQRIGASSHTKVLWVFASTSTNRLHIFYRALFIALVCTAVFGHFAAIANREGQSKGKPGPTAAAAAFEFVEAHHGPIAQASDREPTPFRNIPRS